MSIWFLNSVRVASVRAYLIVRPTRALRTVFVLYEIANVNGPGPCMEDLILSQPLIVSLEGIVELLRPEKTDRIFICLLKRLQEPAVRVSGARHPASRGLGRRRGRLERTQTGNLA